MNNTALMNKLTGYGLDKSERTALAEAIDSVATTYTNVGISKAILWDNALRQLESGKPFEFVMQVVRVSENKE